MPGIWLVQGHTSCSGLTGEVAAFKLADITGPGSDRRRIPALSWDSFQGSCVMVLLDETKRRRAGATTEAAASAAAAVIAVTTAKTLAVGNELSSGDANLSSDDAMTTAVTATPAAEGERSGRAAKRILRLVPTARFFLPINLAAFTVLSAGYSSKFTLTLEFPFRIAKDRPDLYRLGRVCSENILADFRANFRLYVYSFNSSDLFSHIKTAFNSSK